MVEIIGPKKRPGAQAPLFDRLCDLSPEEPQESAPWGFLSPMELRDSVMDELDRLLNTRAGKMPENTDELSYGLPTHFGLPNTSEFTPESQSFWPKIASAIETIIRKYEPRLKNPKVIVSHYDLSHQSLALDISGNIQYGKEIERVSFTITATS